MILQYLTVLRNGREGRSPVLNHSLTATGAERYRKYLVYDFAAEERAISNAPSLPLSPVATLTGLLVALI